MSIEEAAEPRKNRRKGNKPKRANMFYVITKKGEMGNSTEWKKLGAFIYLFIFFSLPDALVVLSSQWKRQGKGVYFVTFVSGTWFLFVDQVFYFSFYFVLKIINNLFSIIISNISYFLKFSKNPNYAFKLLFIKIQISLILSFR